MDTPAPHFVDGILEEIFLCLPTPADLARASIASPRFHRIITERSFLRRFRKRHPPPLLGFLDKAQSYHSFVTASAFHPAQAPHPSAPLARALAEAADFTYSFVPKPKRGNWRPCDVRDGRVLLEVDRPGWRKPSSLVVCDPLSRRYRLLPLTPEALAGDPKDRPVELVPFLAPTGDDEDEMSFKVICLGSYQHSLVAYVFSSLTGQWCVAASPSWSSLGTTLTCSSRAIPWAGCRGLSTFDNVRGCFYSMSPWMDKLLVLDPWKMEFSTVDDRTGYHTHLRSLPGQAEYVLAGNDMPRRSRPAQSRSLPRIVVGSEGAIEMFSLVGDHDPNGSFDLYHTSLQNNSESSKEWKLEKIIPLPGRYQYFTISAAEGFLFLGATTEDQPDIDDDSPESFSLTEWDVDYFALDVRTSQLAKLCRGKKKYFMYEDVCWYFGFPPSLSKPTV
uniref:Uncharacterized protein n=1 Tax=Avena sativa TaxID=4498 RepID=A0ACD5V7P9_AVESA